MKKGISSYWRDVVTVTLAYIGVIGSQIATYLIVTHYNSVSPHDAEVIKTLCPKKNIKAAFFNESLKSEGMTFMFFAAYLGVIV